MTYSTQDLLTIINSHRFFRYHKVLKVSTITANSCVSLWPMLLSIAPGAGPCGIPLGVVWYGPVRYYFYSWNHRQHNTIPHHYLHYYDCRRNWFWMVIIHPWHKRTDHKSRCFKCLMDRWRLMDTPCYWFKIMNAKSRENYSHPNPLHQRVRGINHLMHHSFFFNF
jgi:hypothetical protein